MEKSSSTHQRETQDFMNVESFSQLPFLRPAPPPVKEKSIRLFGIEFGGAPDQSESAETETASASTSELELKETDHNGESSRKFECHYCCRNFPTSQALGGHQNAHKRERQQAKRAHLHSAILHGGASFSYSAAVYNLMNHHHLGSMPARAVANYHSSTANANYAAATPRARFYPQPPINGSPLSLWGVPASGQQTPGGAFSRDSSSIHHSSAPLMFAGHDEVRRLPVMGGSASQSRNVYESQSTVDDHLFL
ncbi:zinc finger protein 8-like isoform X2 [Diospyros lotus]|uniref:zinc finger protein 8-like isoform X2 n=1 Tax=Diospyros lotus TaxID=55363 RepID=UPI0022568843|nr:zinc finger protein 8-like isoform X2 [Diospyros lotus]